MKNARKENGEAPDEATKPPTRGQGPHPTPLLTFTSLASHITGLLLSQLYIYKEIQVTGQFI